MLVVALATPEPLATPEIREWAAMVVLAGVLLGTFIAPASAVIIRAPTYAVAKEELATMAALLPPEIPEAPETTETQHLP